MESVDDSAGNVAVTTDAVAIATVGGTALAMMLAFGAYIRRSIKNSIDNLASVLDERLETKENVAKLTVRVAVLENEAANALSNKSVAASYGRPLFSLRGRRYPV